MSTAVASIAPSMPPSLSHHDPNPSSAYSTPPTSGLAVGSNNNSNERKSPASAAHHSPIVVSEGVAQQKGSADGKRSPHQFRAGHPPKIIVKKEPPSSPEVPASSRHRPHKLDLTSSTPRGGAQGSLTSRPSGPYTARESGSLGGMHDVGLACLSPGFQTHDPSMREQLQRSISVRDQQRHIIESRLQKTAKTSDSAGERPTDHNPFGGLKTPMSSKKRPPQGLSIVPPSHEQFANERVIQSAPLNQSFTGRHHPHPLTRHTASGPSNLSNTSHIHQTPPVQTQNRLPPIADVFAGDGLGINRDSHGRNGSSYIPNSHSSHSNHLPPFPSPGLPPQSHSGPLSGRPREYRSAEEAVADMAGGREENLPKIVHYSGPQPPTPPSPTRQNLTPSKPVYHHVNGEPANQNGSGRRRPRAEYERDNGTPPLGTGREQKRGPFGEGRDSPTSNLRKKEEFLTLCSRAWELFHS